MHRREYIRTLPCLVTELEGLHVLISCLFYTAELVAKLYEAAVKKVPLSEEYHSHLFMAYARVGEYKKMQQVRKLAGAIPYKHASIRD